MRSIYSENRANFGQVPYMHPQMQYNQVQMPIFRCPSMMAPQMNTHGQKFIKVVAKIGSNVKRCSALTTEDFVSEGTHHDSPNANTHLLGSFEDAVASFTTPLAKKVSEFCTCEVYKNCTVADDTTHYHISANDLSMELNKETTSCQPSYDDIHALDANFLFPMQKTERKGTKILSSDSKNSLYKSDSSVKLEKKVFKV